MCSGSQNSHVYFGLSSSMLTSCCLDSSPTLLQPTVLWAGHCFSRGRMAYGSSQHQHVSNMKKRDLEWINMLTVSSSSHRFTYEIAPIFILMEHIVLKKMRQCIGWQDEGDSILAPGGAISNLYAVMIARHKMFPEFKEKGLRSLPQLVLFTSEHVSRTSWIVCLSFFFVDDTRRA